ncbi:phosphatidic acid phosphatase type 2/haloperoxidase [Rhypophila decipiens]|uniref:Phosphatidic acid phosphatase type 2/haloperoxidase n=1 Tax=Rhypophila decipiens TaxID=261697 RepID=A0AAN6XWY2_9PEZI|nr:phosphatidic acid phosphatase type 2/haloperoxidase [Rhypophila decipiens]
MGLFSRTGAKSNGANTTNGQHATHNAYSMSIRPTFGQWLKVTWLDILTMAVLGAVGLGVYMAKPAPTRSFAVTDPFNGEGVYPQFAYPLRHEIVPSWAAALLAAPVPITIILLMQVRIRSFWDVNNAVVGLLYSLITAAVFQVFIKWLIGGLRPHFLDACKPDLTKLNGLGTISSNKGANGLNGVGDSMPSGHTTAAFAGFVFLSLYLNAKLKVWSNYHPAMWKLVAIWAPILGACLIGGSLTIDEFHNWYDVLAGAVIGTVMAISAYRMVFANTSRGDWDMEGVGAVATRRGGWGVGGQGHEKGGLAGQEHGVLGSEAGTHGAGRTGIHFPSRKPVASGSGPAAGDNMV